MASLRGTMNGSGALPDDLQYEPKPYYMKYVKWIFVVSFVCSLVSFIDKDKIGRGYGVGDKAPEFTLSTVGGGDGELSLSGLQGRYVLLSFWATHDAPSRVRNVQLYQAVRRLPEEVKMVSVSFDEYPSVFRETIKSDGIDPEVSAVGLENQQSRLFRQYRLERGFQNYLLDERGIIVAKNVSAEELAAYLN